MKRKTLYTGWIAVIILLAGCQPKTNIEKIDALKKQIGVSSKSLNELENKNFVQLEKDFITCDSLLQYMSTDAVNEAFQKLQLADAYIKQFKEVRPVMQAEIDSTLIRLDQLKADAESHYFSDSLVSVYINDETRQVNLLDNQIQYFKDRFETCQKDLNLLKKKK